jgi:membrane protein DedA with SNARE-associated domain
MIEALVNFVTDGIAALGYTGIAWMMAVESACVPLPSEIIMPFSGFLVYAGKLNLHLVALAGAFGNLIGSIVAYAAGYYGGRPFIMRYGRYILIKQHELEMADRFFHRWGQWAILLGRNLPIIRTYISLPAGVSRMRFTPFCLLSFFGSIPWCYLLTYVGMKLGENWEGIRKYTHILDFIIAAALLFLIVRWIMGRFGKRPAMS